MRSVVPTVSDTKRLDSLLCGLVSPLFRNSLSFQPPPRKNRKISRIVPLFFSTRLGSGVSVWGEERLEEGVEKGVIARQGKEGRKAGKGREILKAADVSLAEPEIPISESEAGLTPRHNRSFINRGS